MKTFRKLGFGLSTLVVVSLFLVIYPKTAAAASIDNSSFSNGQYNIIAFQDGKPKVIDAIIGGVDYTFTDRDTTDTIMNFKTPDNVGLICSQVTNGWNNDLGINLSGNPQAAPGGGSYYMGYITLNYSGNTNTKCNDNNAQKFLPKTNIAAIFNVNGTISGSPITGAPGTAPKDAICTGGADCVKGVCTKSNGACTVVATDQSGPDACAQNGGGWALTWAACPLLEAASGLSANLIDIFEGQLSFNVNQLGNPNAANCGPTVNKPTCGASKIHQSWALIRDISTAMLVVVMLVMIFSQAISFGPFDAYTLRKLLPKLIAAVILIQISWVGVIYVIDLVNAIAKGLADLMYYPFGGSSNMDLYHLLQNAKLSNTLLVSINYAALVVGIALGAAFLFTMLGVAFVALIALFFAVLTLIFRKILIIVLLIFVPLALLAWILPGTDRYWKMWRENFIKALFMFPIAVAIIAAGRIFAYVVGSQDNGQLLNLIFILVGFFGPLFILPKTFKWGGQAMQMAGNGIMKASTKVSERPKKFMDKRQGEWSAERRRQSEERYSHGVGFSAKAPWRRPLDLLRSGQLDITQGTGRIAIGGKTIKQASRRREHAMTAYAAAGAESEEKDIKEADARANLMFAQVDDHDGLARLLANGGKDSTGKVVDKFIDSTTGKVVDIGHVDESMTRAGLNAVAKYGGDNNYQFLDKRIEELRSSSKSEDREMGKKFLDANVGTLQSKLKHFYYGPERDGAIHSMVGSISESSFVGMEGVEMQAILESLNRKAAAGDVDAVSDLKRVMTFYNSAINNPNIRPNIGSGVNKAMEAFVDGHNITDINKSRARHAPTKPGGVGLKPLGRSVVADPRLSNEVSALKGRIDTLGNIQEPTTATTPIVNPRTEWFKSVGDFDIANLAARVGGYKGFSNDDLQQIYNERSGSIKSEAEAELRDRGLIP